MRRRTARGGLAALALFVSACGSLLGVEDVGYVGIDASLTPHAEAGDSSSSPLGDAGLGTDAAADARSEPETAPADARPELDAAPDAAADGCADDGGRCSLQQTCCGSLACRSVGTCGPCGLEGAPCGASTECCTGLKCIAGGVCM